jgi:hypothetical protein
MNDETFTFLLIVGLLIAASILQGMMTKPESVNGRKQSTYLAVEIADELIRALSVKSNGHEGKNEK